LIFSQIFSRKFFSYLFRIFSISLKFFSLKLFYLSKIFLDFFSLSLKLPLNFFLSLRKYFLIFFSESFLSQNDKNLLKKEKKMVGRSTVGSPSLRSTVN